ncbi:MAG: class I SAM-dependent methyltransferase [Planctomycetota bacterium]|nr:MAG: class I SAM-dependent methyltransferase [Planctomycetota bacterium]
MPESQIDQKPLRPIKWRRWFRRTFLTGPVRRMPRSWRILDIACGYGLFGEIRQKTVVGIERDEASLAHSACIGFPLVRGDITATLPFRDGAFDAAVAHDVLEHLTSVENRNLFREVRRVLRPAGTFLIFVPNRKGFELGIRQKVGHVLFVQRKEIEEFASGLFSTVHTGSWPLPSFIGDFANHNKLIACLRRIP